MLEHLSSTHSSSSDVVFSMEFGSAGFQSLTHVLQGVPSLTPLALEDVPHPVDPEAFDVLRSKQQDVDMCLRAAQVMKSAKAIETLYAGSPFRFQHPVPSAPPFPTKAA